MSEFAICSWVVCLFTLIIFIWIFVSSRYLLVKPSIIFILFFHFQIQWVSTIKSEYITEFLHYPWHYFYLAQIFPLTVLLVSLLIGRRFAKKIVITSCYILNKSPRSKLRGINPDEIKYPNSKDGHTILLWVLFIFIVLITSWYLIVVPFSKTGLYAMMLSLPNQDIIREDTFKLLDNPLLIYSYSLMSTVMAPIAIILLSFEIEKNRSPIRPIKLAIYFLGSCFILLVVSIYGSKAPALMLLLSILMAFYIREGMPFIPLRMAFMLMMLLILPSVMSILINNTSFDPSTFYSYYVDVFDRTFGRIMLPGLWYVDYAQRFGYIGIAGIPKIAFLFGFTPIDSANIIGKAYSPNALESVSATTCFIFTYYSYFGLGAFIPCVIISLLLDGLVWVYLAIDKSIRIPVISACSIATVNFIQTQFTTVLFTGGLIPIVILGAVWTLLIPKIRNRNHMWMPDNKIKIG